jgi:DNA-binding Lrp family transcriptional regulator
MGSNLNEKLDDVDLRIINLLQEDSRLSYNKIARKLGISVGTAYNRIKSLEERGVVKGYTVLVDMAKVGYNLTALILIQAEGKHLLDVENEIAKMNNVVSVYDITGDFDIAVIARFKDRDSLNQFIKSLLSLPYVKRTVTNVVLNVVKEDLKLKIP